MKQNWINGFFKKNYCFNMYKLNIYSCMQNIKIWTTSHNRIMSKGKQKKTKLWKLKTKSRIDGNVFIINAKYKLKKKSNYTEKTNKHLFILAFLNFYFKKEIKAFLINKVIFIMLIYAKTPKWKFSRFCLLKTMFFTFYKINTWQKK